MANTDLVALMTARDSAVGNEDLAELLPDGPPVPAGTEIERFWEWADAPVAGGPRGESLANLVHHMSTFWAVREQPNILLLHYDDLKADLDGQMRRVSAQLGIPVDEERWPALVEAATFEQMRANADRVAPDTTNRIWQDNREFFHRGTSGQWGALLDAAGLDRYFARVAELAPDDLARWLHREPRARVAASRRPVTLSPVSSLLRFWRRSAPAAPDAGGLPPPDTSLHPVGGVSADRGANQMRLLRHWGLQPSSHVLEIGCGVGRLAYELASFLDTGGRYSGFDISPKAIGWLNEHYAPRLPNFRFDLVDVRNARYRPAQGGEAATVEFPYADDRFDVACAFAVFMHMPLPEISNYFEEIRRVLKPRGFAVATFRSIAAGERPPRTRDRDWVAVGDGVYSIFPETPGTRSRTTTRSCARRSRVPVSTSRERPTASGTGGPQPTARPGSAPMPTS